MRFLSITFYSWVVQLSYLFCYFFESCPSLCNSMDCHLPGSSVHGILQARMLEWVAISSSRGSSQPRDQTHVSCLAGGFFLPLSHLGKPHHIYNCLLFTPLLSLSLFLRGQLVGVGLCYFSCLCHLELSILCDSIYSLLVCQLYFL